VEHRFRLQRRHPALAAALGLLMPAAGAALEITPAPAAIPLLTPAAVHAAAARAPQLPLAFEPAGPESGGWRFAARGEGYLIGLAGHETLLLLRVPAAAGTEDAAEDNPPPGRHAPGPRSVAAHHAVRLRLEGARTDAPWAAEAPLPGKMHRLLGNDPARWQRGLDTYARVRWREVYPGIDVVYCGAGRELEYDFIVAPGADPAAVALRFEGATVRGLDAEGALLLDVAGRTLRQHRPVAWQDLPEGRRAVAAAHRVAADGTVRLALGTYDPRHALTVDPVLSYATYLGGTGIDQVWDIAVADAEGALIVAGETESLFFPTNIFPLEGAFQTNLAGGFGGAGGDAFVARLAASGTNYDWITYLGGGDIDAAYSVAVTTNGAIVVGGFTASTNFPVTAGTYQPQIGGTNIGRTPRYEMDAFISRLTPDGSALEASTYYGGGGADQLIQLRLAADGGVVFAGRTTSTNLPLMNPVQATNAGAGEAFVARLDAALGTLTAATYYGGTGAESAETLALDAAGRVILAGYTTSTNFPVVAPLQATNQGGTDAFVARLTADLGAVEFATYLGGAGTELAYRVAARPDGLFTVVGETLSTNFPVTPGALAVTNAGSSDAFLATFAPDGTLAWSGLYGGASADIPWNAAADAENRLLLTLQTGSGGLPGVTSNSIRTNLAGGWDAALVRLGPAGEVLYATYFGGEGEEIPYGLALDAAGNAHVGGRTRTASGLPLTTNAAQTTYGGGAADGFLFKVSFEPALAAARAAVGVTVSWPAPNLDFRLTTHPLPGGTNWAAVTNAPVTVDGRHTVLLPADATNAAFRLQSP
jgi:hypothetical protein